MSTHFDIYICLYLYNDFLKHSFLICQFHSYELWKNMHNKAVCKNESAEDFQRLNYADLTLNCPMVVSCIYECLNLRHDCFVSQLVSLLSLF